MPEFDLRKMYFAEYNNNNGVVTYGTVLDAGDAMNTNWEFRYAEGRLYAASTLAEFIREAVGGTVSVAVKYFPAAVQQLLFGDSPRTRSISYTPAGASEPVTKEITSQVYGGNSRAKNVGFAGYALDLIDGAQKVTAFKLARVLFGKPGKSLQTKGGDTINFATPTSSGEFMADHSGNKDMVEMAILDTEEEADAWCRASLPAAQTQAASETPAGEGSGENGGGA